MVCTRKCGYKIYLRKAATGKKTRTPIPRSTLWNQKVKAQFRRENGFLRNAAGNVFLLLLKNTDFKIDINRFGLMVPHYVILYGDYNNHLNSFALMICKRM